MRSSGFRIEKGIDLPCRLNGAAGRHKASYPFCEMDVGDSFFIFEPDPFERAKRQSSILATARRSAKSKDLHFTTRQEDDGVRVWRIARPD